MARRTVDLGAIAAVVMAVGVGLAHLGPPSEARARRLDDRRVDDLSHLARRVDRYWTARRRLPDTLDDLQARDAPAVVDPVSGEAYEYRVVDGDTFELCARFGTMTEDARRNDRWWHAAGRHCFEVTAKTRRRAPRGGWRAGDRTGTQAPRRDDPPGASRLPWQR